MAVPDRDQHGEELPGVDGTAGADDGVSIGYFPTVTHAPALVADGEGLFEPEEPAPAPQVSRRGLLGG